MVQVELVFIFFDFQFGNHHSISENTVGRFSLQGRDSQRFCQAEYIPDYLCFTDSRADQI